MAHLLDQDAFEIPLIDELDLHLITIALQPNATAGVELNRINSSHFGSLTRNLKEGQSARSEVAREFIYWMFASRRNSQI